MAGFNDFADGNVLFAAQVDGYLMRQTAMRFGTTTQLVNALTAGIREVGMIAWADSTGIYYLWDGTNWIPWQSPEKTFSPIFTAGGSNITVGNSIVNSWWRYSGGMVQWNFRFVIGSTANLGVGNYALSLPVSTRTEHDHHYIGHMTYYDQSVGTHYHRACATVGTTTSFAMVDSNGTLLSAASPVAWANNDQFGMSIRYLPSTGVYL